MKKNKLLNPFLLSIICLIMIFPLTTCKKFGTPDYAVKIIFDGGVEGSPEAGTHYYEDLTSITYNYTPTDTKHSLEVIVEGVNWMTYGNFTVYGDMEIIVKRFDVRGTWQLIRMNEDGSETFETFNITFFGVDMLSGTIKDDRDKTGTWVKEANKIDIYYDNWEEYHMICGTVVTSDHKLVLRGNWNNGEEFGIWDATWVGGN